MELCEFAASQKVDVEAEADTWLRRVRPCGVRKPPGTQGSFEKSVAHQNSERYPCVRNVSCRQLHDYIWELKSWLCCSIIMRNYWEKRTPYCIPVTWHQDLRRGRSGSTGILVVLATKKNGFSFELNSSSLSSSLERVALYLPLAPLPVTVVCAAFWSGIHLYVHYFPFPLCFRFTPEIFPL